MSRSELTTPQSESATHTNPVASRSEPVVPQRPEAGAAEPEPRTRAEVGLPQRGSGGPTAGTGIPRRGSAAAGSESDPARPPLRARQHTEHPTAAETTSLAETSQRAATSPRGETTRHAESAPPAEAVARNDSTRARRTLEPTPTRRAANHRQAAARDDSPTTVDVQLVMQLLLASHNLENIAKKAEAGEISLDDFIRAAHRTRTAAVDLVSAWFGGAAQMRQFAEALLAATEPT
ncbi:hypothetical protein [Nocardia thraciensis]